MFHNLLAPYPRAIVVARTSLLLVLLLVLSIFLALLERVKVVLASCSVSRVFLQARVQTLLVESANAL